MTSQDQISTFTGRHPHGNVLLEYHTVTDNITMIAHNIHVILSSFSFLGQTTSWIVGKNSPSVSVSPGNGQSNLSVTYNSRNCLDDSSLGPTGDWRESKYEKLFQYRGPLFILIIRAFYI